MKPPPGTGSLGLFLPQLGTHPNELFTQEGLIRVSTVFVVDSQTRSRDGPTTSPGVSETFTLLGKSVWKP